MVSVIAGQNDRIVLPSLIGVGWGGTLGEKFLPEVRTIPTLVGSVYCIREKGQANDRGSAEGTRRLILPPCLRILIRLFAWILPTESAQQ